MIGYYRGGTFPESGAPAMSVGYAHVIAKKIYFYKEVIEKTYLYN
jgi:hypothetical protein